MDTKLTVRVPRHLLENTKRYAKENNTTFTALITAYLRQLPEEKSVLNDAPIVQRLTASLSPDISIVDYEEHLEEKYG